MKWLAFIAPWHGRPDVMAVLFVVALFYVRGWVMLRRRGFRRIATVPHLVASLGSAAVTATALLSPLDTFQRALLSAHMIQHELLMVLAVPLALFGRPLPIAFWGLPRVARICAGRLLRPKALLRRAFDALTASLPALAISTAILWGWHLPAAYNAVEDNGMLHNVQHLFFFASALLFWWPVIGAPPIVRRMSLPLLSGYLIVGMTQRSLLGALITLADHVIYRHYGAARGIAAGTALRDQHVAGAIMWFGSGIVLLAITFLIIWRTPEPSRFDRESDRAATEREEFIPATVR
jgi:putative membrane protein